MENFRPPFTHSTTITTSSSPYPTLESSSHHSYPSVCYLPPHPRWQQPPCLPYPPPMSPFPFSSSAAGNKRMARERRSEILRTKRAARAAAASEGAASSRVVVEKDLPSAVPETQDEPYIYSFYTPDNKKLRFLFKKELKNSDVGSLGRIVLPKREAERYLPSLSDKEGMELRIRDALSNQWWDVRYKYWSNSKSRMYVLENTGEFVRQSGVGVGDNIHLYEDECKNLYVFIHRHSGARPVHVFEPISTSQQHYTETNTDNNANDNTNSKNTTGIYKPYAYDETRSTNEDETSGLVLQHQQRNEQLIETTTSIVTLFAESAYSCRQVEEASNSNNDVIRRQQTSTQPAMAASSSSPSVVQTAEDNFGDWLNSLTLPEVDDFENSLFDNFDDIFRDD